MELTPGKLIALALLVLVVVSLVQPDLLKFGKTKTTETQQISGVAQGGAVAGGEAGGGEEEGTVTLPKYQVSNVYLYVKDKLNPKAGVSGIEVEVLAVPEVYDMNTLSKLASDPNRQVVDEDTSTDSAGKAEFTAGRIFVNTPYLYSIRGDSTVYDKLVVKTIPVPSIYFKIDSYTFEEPEYVYKVGNFSDISTDADNTLTASDLSCLNITGKTGTQYCEFDITIGEATAGAALKDPVLILRSPEGYELEPGDIVSLYIVKKTGSDLGIPAQDLTEYVTYATPIDLKGSLYDEEYGVDFMTVSDSATYTVKLSYDADQIQTDGDKLQICLDDLGDYRARDVATKGTKASPMCLVIQWGS